MSQHANLRLCIFALLLVGATADVQGATIDFESVAIGTVFGHPAGDFDGEVVLLQDGITMSVQNFLYGTLEKFGDATIGGRYAGFFDTAPLELDNISVLFDFTELPFLASSASFEFAYFGGLINFSVNGTDVFEIGQFSELPVVVAPNVTATVSDGFVSLSGPIRSMLVGGQELSIDDVSVVPEPATWIFMTLCGGLVLGRRHKQG